MNKIIVIGCPGAGKSTFARKLQAITELPLYYLDMLWVETEFDEEFKQWILDFPQNELPAVYALLNKYKDQKDIIVFKSRKSSLGRCTKKNWACRAYGKRN